MSPEDLLCSGWERESVKCLSAPEEAPGEGGKAAGLVGREHSAPEKQEWAWTQVTGSGGWRRICSQESGRSGGSVGNTYRRLPRAVQYENQEAAPKPEKRALLSQETTCSGVAFQAQLLVMEVNVKAWLGKTGLCCDVNELFLSRPWKASNAGKTCL